MNLGSIQGWSLKEFARTLRVLIGKSLNASQAEWWAVDMAIRVLDIGVAPSSMSFKPAVPLRVKPNVTAS